MAQQPDNNWSPEGLSEVSEEKIREAYDEVVAGIQNNKLQKNACPTLSMLSFAIRCIICGEFIIKRLHDVIALICSVEMLRRRLAEHARVALTWDKYYRDPKNQRKDVRVLTEAQQRDFCSIAENVTLRKLFRSILNRLFELNIRELLRSLIDGDLAVRLRVGEEIDWCLRLYCIDDCDGKEDPPGKPPYRQAFQLFFREDLEDDERAEFALVAGTVLDAVCRIGSAVEHTSVSSESERDHLAILSDPFLTISHTKLVDDIEDYLRDIECMESICRAAER
ncbi:hypothetical protein K474DRAFT_1770420 [Panus rudis PR-1116 ss-1]|nr:hypothetical protein K474DRAFT_1770420 [Panus rudis PR-1116 ss-1]